MIPPGCRTESVLSDLAGGLRFVVCSLALFPLALVLPIIGSERDSVLEPSETQQHRQGSPASVAAAEGAFAAAEELRLQQTNSARRQSLAQYLEAARLFKALGALEREADALSIRSGVHFSLGGLQEALDDASTALKLYRQVGNQDAVARTLNRLANIHGRMGAVDSQISNYLEGIELSRARGNRAFEGTLVSYLALVYESEGDDRRALQLNHQVLGLARASGNRTLEAYALRRIGRFAAARGDTNEALTLS